MSGDFNLVLQQSGVVSVKENGELFATEVVCDVAEGEQRRWLTPKSPVVSSSQQFLYLMLYYHQQ